MRDTPDIALFQRRLGETRKARKMSLEDVAKASGFTKSHVWELERGKSTNPSIRAVWGLASALGVSPAYLIGLDDKQADLDPLAIRIATIINMELAQRVEEAEARASESFVPAMGRAVA